LIKLLLERKFLLLLGSQKGPALSLMIFPVGSKHLNSISRLHRLRVEFFKLDGNVSDHFLNSACVVFVLCRVANNFAPDPSLVLAGEEEDERFY